MASKVRNDIFKILDDKYDVDKEFNKINSLFATYLILYTNPLDFKTYQLTIENLIDEKFLLFWKQRRSYFCCKEMREDIGFSVESYTTQNIILALEYYTNLINLINLKTANPNTVSFQFYKEFYLLVQNIDILIEHLNHEKLFINNEEKVLLIPKNPAATAVAEISSKENALSILMYNHASLKGNLQAKREILNNIYVENEPILNSPEEHYKDFYKKAKQLFNNLHIRHNNKAIKNNKNTVISIDEIELEKWYDELYQLMLFCILVNDNIERKGQVEQFLKNIKRQK